MNWRDVPIPALMKHLPLDKRGYPIIPLIMQDANGPKFAVNDEQKRQQYLREDRCGICGNKLYRARWLVGGPGAAFLEHGAYLDPPTHTECLHYALQVCPYLAAPNYKTAVGLSQAKNAMFEDPRQVIVTIGTDTDPLFPKRPDLFVAVQYVGKVKLHANQDGLPVIDPPRDFRQIEYWMGGKQLAQADGETLARVIAAEMTAKLIESGLPV